MLNEYINKQVNECQAKLLWIWSILSHYIQALHKAKNILLKLWYENNTILQYNSQGKTPTVKNVTIDWVSCWYLNYLIIMENLKKKMCKTTSQLVSQLS